MDMAGRDIKTSRNISTGELLDYECDAAQAHQCARLLARHKLAESNLCVVENPKETKPSASGTTALGPVPVESGTVPRLLTQGNSTA